MVASACTGGSAKGIATNLAADAATSAAAAAKDEESKRDVLATKVAAVALSEVEVELEAAIAQVMNCTDPDLQVSNLNCL